MAASTRRRLLIRIVAILVAGVLLVLGAAAVWLLPRQRKLIFFPRDYADTYKVSLPPGTREISYVVDGHAQTSFYIPPRVAPAAGSAPPIVVMFNGNGSVALDWLDVARTQPRDDLAFFLVDFPGYGLCEGSPSRVSIIAAIEASWPALARELGVSVEQLDADVSTLGFSMGAAAAMEFAVRRPVKRVVLLAPFTSLRDMATRVAGSFVSMFLLDRFDNRARLDELAKRASPPRVMVCHGSKDSVIPVEMGRELGARHPAFTRIVEFPGVDHADLPGTAGPTIVAEFTSQGSGP